uniref:Uncharacterized protein n=1 Tax=Myripristis murdjan TaxID=586833 RepID=A0A667YMZ9_9TELE
KGRAMRRQRGPPLLALSAVLLCTFHQTAGSSRARSSPASSAPASEVRGRDHLRGCNWTEGWWATRDRCGSGGKPAPHCPTKDIKLLVEWKLHSNRPRRLCGVYCVTLWDAGHCDCHDNGWGRYLRDAGHHLLARGIYHREHHDNKTQQNQIKKKAQT